MCSIFTVYLSNKTLLPLKLLYRTVKNFDSGKTLVDLVNYSNLPSFLPTGFHNNNFHSIAYGFTTARLLPIKAIERFFGLLLLTRLTHSQLYDPI